jgi:hypothetical protein
MDGQTTIEPCAICGELSERLVEVEPARTRKLKIGGVERIVECESVKRWLCNRHAEHAEHADARKAQEKERAKWLKRKFENAQAESTLFDVDDDGPRPHYEEAA